MQDIIMDKQFDKRTEVYLLCRTKADELINTYFGGFTEEAAYERPESLKEKYDEGLPLRVEDIFLVWLKERWQELSKDSLNPSSSFEEIMDQEKSLKMVDLAYVDDLDKARTDAEEVSLWERITNSNHNDVTYYVGLLKQYTEERLDVLAYDFANEFIGQE